MKPPTKNEIFKDIFREMGMSEQKVDEMVAWTKHHFGVLPHMERPLSPEEAKEFREQMRQVIQRFQYVSQFPGGEAVLMKMVCHAKDGLKKDSRKN